MRFYLTKRESTHQSIKRIFTGLIKENISLLNNHSEEVDKSIHDCRKNFKKLRAVLRLVRSDLSPHFYKTHNIHFRNLSRKIAGLRDSFVIIEALENLLKSNNQKVDEFENLINFLREEYFQTKNRILFQENQPQSVITSLNLSLDEFENLPKIEEGFAALGNGIKTIYSKGKYFLELTYSNPTSEVFHEWRKNVKYLWHLLQIIQPVNYQVIKRMTINFKKLSDFIGDEHDLHELQLLLINRNVTNESLFRMINKKQFELRSDAWKLGEKLYEKDADEFTARLESYYKKWKEK